MIMIMMMLMKMMMIMIKIIMINIYWQMTVTMIIAMETSITITIMIVVVIDDGVTKCPYCMHSQAPLVSPYFPSIPVFQPVPWQKANNYYINNITKELRKHVIINLIGNYSVRSLPCAKYCLAVAAPLRDKLHTCNIICRAKFKIVAVQNRSKSSQDKVRKTSQQLQH